MSATGANDFRNVIVVARVGANVRITLPNDANATEAVLRLLATSVAAIEATDFPAVA